MILASIYAYNVGRNSNSAQILAAKYIVVNVSAFWKQAWQQILKPHTMAVS
jgi:hypothetical protein